MPYVYSTNSTSVGYTEYRPGQGAGGLPTPIRTVVVKGGANVANKNLVTPYGVATRVSDDDAAFLSTNADFIRHRKAGFVRIDDRKMDPEVPAADMEARDGSAPLVDADFDKPPKVLTPA